MRILGVYYPVGAFVVGIAARRFGDRLAAVASQELLRSIELFAGFFVPFYFFKAGLRLTSRDFGWRSLAMGASLLIVMVPLCVVIVAFHRPRAFTRRPVIAARVGISLLLPLVFTLVIANMLREQYDLSSTCYGALIVYALGTTGIPGVALGATAEHASHLPPFFRAGLYGGQLAEVQLFEKGIAGWASHAYCEILDFESYCMQWARGVEAEGVFPTRARDIRNLVVP